MGYIYPTPQEERRRLEASLTELVKSKEYKRALKRLQKKKKRI